MFFRSIFLAAIFMSYLIPVSANSVPRNPDKSLGIEFRSSENPYYWKNNPPFAGYWQQDVHYQIAARLDIETRIIYGSEKLTYYNNSPDTLKFVYFHLYQNAFKPGSYLDQYLQSDHSDAIKRLTGTRKGEIKIEKMADGDNLALPMQLDNTILRVELNQALLPNDSTIFQIDFKTYFGNYLRRMNYNPSRGVEQFNTAHWYPRIVVYDRNAGWNADQHLEREFYGDFGTFEVNLTLPHDFIVAATGFLLNRDEVLPDSLMQKLDVVNFLETDHTKPTTEIIEREPGLTKTWRYKAVNVHDFAWTADPSFRIGTAVWNDVTCYSFVREWKAAYWQDAAQFAADVIRILSQDFGQYGYHKMIVADVDDGMEYPMITFDGGFSPDYYNLLAHEIGHNWFYGMVGSNETYSPFMDEGFAQFLTAWTMEKLVRSPDAVKNEGSYEYANDSRERYSNYIQYYNTVKSGRDIHLETHSDKINLENKGRLQYWQTYYKTAVMLYNLQYVLGDELYREAMAYYVEKWKFCHPQREDFYQTITEFTGWDLRWFFDQWTKKIRTVDYSIEKFKAVPQQGAWIAKVKIKRKGTAIMPLDLVFTFKDGSTQKAIIPVGYEFKNEKAAIILPKWTGWGRFNQTYEAEIILKNNPVALEIDPSHRLADIYQLDNYASVLPRVQFEPAWRFSHWQADKYKFTWRPKVGYNNVDGLRAGVHFDGGYLNGMGNGDHQIDLQLNLGAKIPNAPVGYRFSYTQPVERWNREAHVTFASLRDHGYQAQGISFSHILSGHNLEGEEQNFTSVDLALKWGSIYDATYLHSPWFWENSTDLRTANSIKTFQSTIDRRYSFGRTWKQKGQIKVRFTNALPGSDHLYSKVRIEAKNTLQFFKFKLRTRAILGYATANTAAHSLFYSSMGSPGEWISNGWLNAKGALPSAWARDGRIHPAGGGNLRALHEKSMIAMKKYTSVAGFGGNRLAGGNLEVALWNPFKKPLQSLPGINPLLQFKLYAFADAAALNFLENDDKFNLPEPVYDGGIGILWTPQFRNGMNSLFGKLTQFRFDFPVYLSDPPSGEKEIEFRWVVGVGRAF
ncbi:MAG: M1 family peptidase [Calditrichaeota bacterium]|nr:MAG: M1 family peptidase [Calditrichota bacterium]